MLSAEFTDRKACPHCGYPVRRLGSWSVEMGQWYFKPRPLSARIKKGSRPEWGGEHYTNIPQSIETQDRAGRTVEVVEDVWHDLRHFECMGTVYGDCEASAPYREVDVVDYTGEEYDWMLPPAPPEQQSPDVRSLAREWKRDQAGDRE